MKNNLKLLLIPVLCLPVIVKADMGAPAIPEYQATINNPNGITINGKKLENGTKVTVYFEEYEGKEYICSIKDYGETPCKNIMPVEKEFNLNNAIKTKRVTKLKEKIEGIVLNPNGVDIYSGPSVSYEKTSNTLSLNSKVTIEYFSGGDGASSDSDISSAVWVHVKTNSTEGWVLALNKSIGYQTKNTSGLVAIDSKVYDYNNKELFSISADEEIKILYETDAWSGSKYIEYKNQKGFIYENSLAYNAKGNITLKDERKLLKSANSEGKDVIDTIKGGEKLEFTKTFGDYGESWFYVTYNNQKGWIYYSENESPEVNYYKEQEEPQKEEQESTPVTEPAKEPQKTVEQNLVMYILVALVVVLTAIVVMLLINKNSKEKDLNN